MRHPSDRFTYIQSTGFLFYGPVLVATCYSGHGTGINNSAMEGVKSVGPVPAGTYQLGNVRNSPSTGPLSIRLAPDTDTRARIITLGRSPDSFLIHGAARNDTDRRSSKGCIIASRPQRLTVIAAMQDPRGTTLAVIAACSCAVCASIHTQ